MPSAYIVAAARTAGGKKGGALRDWHPADLGAKVLDALVERAGNGNADVSLVNQKIQGDLSQLDVGSAFLQVSGYELSMQASQKVYTRVAAISLFDLM